MSEYLKVLMSVKRCPKAFQSNYARYHSALFAEAASRGHISCLSADGRNNGAWELTHSGMGFLKEYGGAV